MGLLRVRVNPNPKTLNSNRNRNPNPNPNQGLHKRYWRFPCYLAPSVTRVAADAGAQEQGLGPLFEGHPID